MTHEGTKPVSNEEKGKTHEERYVEDLTVRHVKLSNDYSRLHTEEFPKVFL